MKFTTFCRFCLAGVFAAAGVMKLSYIQGFAYDIHLFDLTPWAFSKALAFYIPAFEIAAAAALITPILRIGGLFAILGMSSAFSVAIGSAWYRGLDISCGCFGHSEKSSNFPLHLAATLMMFAISVWLIQRERRNENTGTKET